MVGEEDSENEELDIDEYSNSISRKQKRNAVGFSPNKERCQSKGLKNINEEEGTLIEYGGSMSKAISQHMKFRASMQSTIYIEAIVSGWLNEKWIGSRIC